MKNILLFIFLFISAPGHSQELYVFSEPASNMPRHSVSVKESYKGQKNVFYNSVDSRYSTELMFGISKELMVHTSASFSNMYGSSLKAESGRLYAKYRFFSSDELYSHFRMAVYAEGSYSNNRTFLDDYGFDGDRSGAGAGIVATRLLHKLAISATAGFKTIAKSDIGMPAVNLVDYSLSAGYLIFPSNYKSYDQTNLNLYVEFLGERMLSGSGHYLDMAPAAQLIFNSQAKLNAGYRFKLSSNNMYRSADQSWIISFEWLFLNAF